MAHDTRHGLVNPGYPLSLQSEPPLSPTATPAALALHKNFKASVEALKRDLVRTIHYLTAIGNKNIHRMLGFRSIYEYAETTAGFTEGQTRAFLRIGRRLQDLPEVKKALASGILSWSKAECISRRATPENEIEWIDLARSLSVRELARHVSGPDQDPSPSLPLSGSPTLPSSPPANTASAPKTPQNEPAPLSFKPTPPPAMAPKSATEKCHVTYAFTPEEYSRWEALLEKSGGRTKEEFLLEGLSRMIGGSGGQDSAGRQHLIVLQECPKCRQGLLTNSRGDFQVDQALLQSAKCDAVTQLTDGSRRAVIPPRLRRRVMARDDHRCQYPGCRHTRFLQIHHRLPVSQGGKTELDNLVTLCSKCHRRLHVQEEELQRKGVDPT